MITRDAGSEVSAIEAALRLGVSRERVIRQIQCGKLPGRRDPAEGWRVNLAAIEAATAKVAADVGA